MPKDSKIIAELDFLTALERGEVVTQMNLKQRIGVSVGLINALLKRAIGKGYVKVCRAPYKRYAYYLTPQGFKEKSRLVAAYLESSMDFLRLARSQYSDLFDYALLRGQTRFVLAGDGELAEIAILSTLGRGIEGVVILSPNPDRSHISGVPVVSPQAPEASVGAIIITDALTPQETFERMRVAYPGRMILWPPFLRITPDRDILLRESEEAGAA